jgi:hypothetical protein
MKAIAILLALGLAGPLLSSAQAAEVTPELIADLTMEEEVRLSADGKWVSYIVGVESGGEGGRAKELWMASVDGAPVQTAIVAGPEPGVGRPLGPPMAASQSSPKARTRPAAGNCWCWNRARASCMCSPTAFDGDSVEWSPDGRQLGFVRSESTGPARKRSADEPQVLGCGPAKAAAASAVFIPSTSRRV